MKRVLLVLALLVTGTLFGAPPAAAVELAANGGFESGSLSPWTCTGNLGTIVTTPVHTGTRALRGTTSGSDNARCQQVVAVQPNRTYTLKAWVNGSYVFLGVTGTGTTDTSTWTPSTGGSYAQLSVAFTTGASTTSVTVYLNGWYGQPAYTADDVSLT